MQEFVALVFWFVALVWLSYLQVRWMERPDTQRAFRELSHEWEGLKRAIWDSLPEPVRRGLIWIVRK